MYDRDGVFGFWNESSLEQGQEPSSLIQTIAGNTKTNNSPSLADLSLAVRSGTKEASVYVLYE